MYFCSVCCRCCVSLVSTSRFFFLCISAVPSLSLFCLFFFSTCSAEAGKEQRRRGSGSTATTAPGHLFFFSLCRFDCCCFSFHTSLLCSCSSFFSVCAVFFLRACYSMCVDSIYRFSQSLIPTTSSFKSSVGNKWCCSHHSCIARGPPGGGVQLGRSLFLHGDSRFPFPSPLMVQHLAEGQLPMPASAAAYLSLSLRQLLHRCVCCLSHLIVAQSLSSLLIFALFVYICSRC